MSRPANVATGKCRDRQMSRPANVATGKCRDRQMSRPANVATGKCRDRQNFSRQMSRSANVATGKFATGKCRDRQMSRSAKVRPAKVRPARCQSADVAQSVHAVHEEEPPSTQSLCKLMAHVGPLQAYSPFFKKKIIIINVCKFGVVSQYLQTELLHQLRKRFGNLGRLDQGFLLFVFKSGSERFVRRSFVNKTGIRPHLR